SAYWQMACTLKIEIIVLRIASAPLKYIMLLFPTLYRTTAIPVDYFQFRCHHAKATNILLDRNCVHQG
ncbi:unnamed protein product, partial [Nesidiocoris tenuis]